MAALSYVAQLAVQLAVGGVCLGIRGSVGVCAASTGPLDWDRLGLAG